MDDKEIRLRIVEAVLPIASRVEIQSDELLTKKCEELEKFVIGKKPTAPRKKPMSNGNK